MNTNPNGYDGGDLAGFQDPTPWLEGCDRMNCTAVVGGDHAPTCEVSRYRCFICERDTSDGLYQMVDYGLHVERVCDICWEKRDEDPIEMPLDMTEDD